MTAQTQVDRDQAFLRKLRLPELREAPDSAYAAIVRQANRITRSDWSIRRVERSIERARVGLAEGTWPAVRQSRYVMDQGGYDGTELVVDDDDIVTLAWLMDVCGHRETGLVHLHILHRLAETYYQACERGQHVPWNAIFRYGINGELRSMSAMGLVEHAAPLTWRLTEAGRELVDLVFGSE